jgi:hypothetical protein
MESRMIEQHAGIKVSKLDAARRQLDGAIQLWFSNGDAVATHLLVCASQQVIEDIGKKHGETAYSLVEIMRKVVAPVHLEDALREVRRPSNFFKHADCVFRRTLSVIPAERDR